MRKLYFIAIALLVARGVSEARELVASKINGAGIEIINNYRQGKLDLKNPVLLTPTSRDGAPMVKAVIESSETVADSLSSCGYQVDAIAGDFYVVTMPIDGIESLSESPELISLSFGDMAQPAMNLARIAGAVNTCSTDFRLPHPFKGSGVIVGAFDTGFDPKHVNFMNSNGSATRLVYYANYNTNSGVPRILTGQETLNGTTDNSSESHATHVVGIAAGAYNGAGFTYSGNSTGYFSGNPGTAALGSDMGYIPYYGVAPEADIAVCAGSLVTANILSGIRGMIDFAKSEGKPIVINLSLGSTYGPHDGTETEIEALNALAKEAIICISSGNDGDNGIYAGSDLTAANGGAFNVMLAENFDGIVDCWSSNADPFDVTVMVVNKGSGESVAEATCTGGKSLTINGSTESFETYTTGNLSLVPRLDSRNNRYEVRISGNLSIKSANVDTYAFVLKLSASKPAKIDVYGNSDCGFIGFPLSGYVNPGADGSINGMACGKNTICVGSFNTRQWWFTTVGTAYCFNGSSAADGSISGFSSYGTLADGRELPDFCAPGSAIVSSYSADYVASRPNGIAQTLVGTADFKGATNYWGIMQGTSMSCPYATGTIALWLESNSDLSSEDIKAIVKNTASAPSVASVAWGAGKLNAFKGLQEVIRNYPAGIAGVTVDNDDMIVTPGVGAVEVFAAGAAQVRVELYTVGGALAAQTVGSGDTANISTEGLAKGVYVLRAVADGTRTATRKIAL